MNQIEPGNDHSDQSAGPQGGVRAQYVRGHSLNGQLDIPGQEGWRVFVLCFFFLIAYLHMLHRFFDLPGYLLKYYPVS